LCLNAVLGTFRVKLISSVANDISLHSHHLLDMSVHRITQTYQVLVAGGGGPQHLDLLDQLGHGMARHAILEKMGCSEDVNEGDQVVLQDLSSTVLHPFMVVYLERKYNPPNSPAPEKHHNNMTERGGFTVSIYTPRDYSETCASFGTVHCEPAVEAVAPGPPHQGPGGSDAVKCGLI
jgi:hypothetical protein